MLYDKIVVLSGVDWMNSKRKVGIERELIELKRQLSELKSKNNEISKLASSANTENDATPQMFLLLKYMIEENKRTTMLLKQISDSISRLENEYDTEPMASDQSRNHTQNEIAKQQPIELPLSDIDVKILQLLQLSHNSMACAEDIRDRMNYRGKNAASARLNRLYRLGIIDRYQLGHKVYYKFDAGKATAKTLIVSPP